MAVSPTDVGISRTASSFKWILLSRTIRLMCQSLGMLVLGRLLPPSDFGLVAMASVVTGFGSLFLDLGTGAAVIQRQDLPDRLLNSVFWLNLMLGIGLGLVALLGAPLLAAGFGDPRLINVLRVLALAFPISSLAVVQQALLERATAFRGLAIIESTASIAGLGVGIGTALTGLGVFSLVAQTLSTATAGVSGLWLLSRWRPNGRLCRDELRSIVGYSGNLVGYNLANYFIRNADNILVGRFLGATDLGYYTMAYKIMLWPMQNTTSLLGRVLFPIFSRLQKDRQRMGQIYAQVTVAVVFATAPIVFGLFAVRSEAVEVLLGPRWDRVADLLAWLLPVGLLQSVNALTGPIYLATGRTDALLKWGLGAGVVATASFAIGIRWGITGVCIGYLTFSLIAFWPCLAIPFRFAEMKVGAILTKVLPSITIGLIMAVLVLEAKHIGSFSRLPVWERLTFSVSIGLFAWGILNIVFQRTLMRSLLSAIRS